MIHHMKSLFIFLISMVFSQILSAVEIPQLVSADLITHPEMKSLEGKFKVLIFMNRHCPCTKAHYQHLNLLAQKNPHVAFYGIHSLKGDEMKEVREFYRLNQMQFPLINDPKLIWANALKAVKTPHVFVLDDQDEILYQGAVTNSRDAERASEFFLKEVLEDISQGKELRHKETRSLGCAIVR
ncbi:MAG: hypothetical protein Fur0010_18310 [Bdellovibrio sp.]